MIKKGTKTGGLCLESDTVILNSYSKQGFQGYNKGKRDRGETVPHLMSFCKLFYQKQGLRWIAKRQILLTMENRKLWRAMISQDLKRHGIYEILLEAF